MSLASAPAGSRGWLFAAAAGLALACVAAFAWSSSFGSFVDYDDQGYLQLAVQHVLDGRVPYDEVTVPYGPLYFLQRWLLHGVLHLPLGTDGTRLVTWATWLVSAWMLARATRRALAHAPGAGTWGLVAFVLAGLSLAPMSKEPGHPQELFVLLACAAAWAAGAAPADSRARALVWGGLCGALLMVKINVGVFACIACAASGVLLGEALLVGRILRWVAVAAAVALPQVIMSARIDDPGVRGFALDSTLGLATLAACDWRLARGRARAHAPAAHFALALAAALGFVGLGLAFAFARGSSLAGLVEQLVRTPQRLVAGFQVAYVTPPGSGALLLVGVALGLGWTFGGNVWRARIERLAVPVLRLVLFALLCVSTLDAFLAFSYMPGLVWVLLLPGSRADEPAGTAAWRRALVWFVLLERLQAFPVMGSQIRLGIVLLYPLVVWGTAQTLRARVAPAWTCALLLVGAAAFAVTQTRRYLDGEPLRLPGASWLRLAPHSTGAKRWLALNLRAATTFVSVSAHNSLYGWSGKRPPDLTLISHSWELISDDDQRRLVAALRAAPDPWILDHQGIFRPIERVGRPFFDYAQGEFRCCAGFGGYSILVRRERSDPELIACGAQAEPRELPASLRVGAARSPDFWFDVELDDLPAGTEIAGLRVFEMRGATITADSDPAAQRARIGCFTPQGEPLLDTPGGAPWSLAREHQRVWVRLSPEAVTDKGTAYFLQVLAPKERILRALPLVIRPTRKP